MTDRTGPAPSALDELHARRALAEDSARPEKVAARHAAGGRTARENIADLVRGVLRRAARGGRIAGSGRPVDTW